MIAATAFVLGFLLIGISVLLLAMRGGPRGAREALHTQSARGRTAVAGVIAGVALIFGVGIPAIVLAANSDKNQDGPGGVKLTTAQAHGRAIFAHNCSTCHTLAAANASGKVGPNLDELRPPKGLVKNAIEQGRARGQGQMPAQLVTGQDERDVADFVAAVAGR